MVKKSFFLSSLLSSVLLISSCKKDSVEAADENELITSVKLTFATGGITQTFAYADPDGDGGKAPIIEIINLKANTTYTMTIEILDESKNPVSNITNEVSTKRDEHLFVYTPSPASLLTYSYGDKDSRNLNVGLTGSVKTGATATGKLKVQLRHQPPINGKASKDGSITPGSDDVNIDFNVNIQ
ncbi:hypothetical protein [Emticicia sp. SJ17W-69]|uniref:hypothetical protein n=1 Tax=Emticicia sp. SJ17W-69 TaxID=3421657 RepID=UPI003EBDC42D